MHAVKKIKSVVSVLLAGLFLLTITAREVHYVFVSHARHYHEHCENHLHSNEHNHAHCKICKLDISAFVKAADCALLTEIKPQPDNYSVSYTSIILSYVPQGYSLRGPPAFKA